MAGTIWTQRRAYQMSSSTTPTVSEGEHITIYDPDLSPDWLKMPDSPTLPASIRGKQIRVMHSIWFPLAPNPKASDEDLDNRWLEQRSRWHLLQTSGAFAVVEVAGHGFVVMEVAVGQWQLLLEVAEKQ